MDVGQRFRFCFEVLFITHLLQIVAYILIHLARPQTAININYIVPPITWTILLITSLVLFYSRFVHSGRVCSGDYLDAKTENSSGYLIMQGSFIKTYAAILSITIYLMFCCICFVSAKKTAINSEKRKQQMQDATRLANVV